MKACRIEQGKEQVDRLIRHRKKPFLLLQTRNSYERYHLIQYVKSHKLEFNIVETGQSGRYLWENVPSFKYDAFQGNPFGPKEAFSYWYCKKPVKYIKVYRPSIA